MTKKTETEDVLDMPEEMQEVEANPVEEIIKPETSVLSEDVTVLEEQPKTEKKKCFLSTITLDNWIIICSLFGMVFQFLANLLLGITMSTVVYQVFAYLGYIAVMAGMVIYVVQMLRTKVIAFTPQLILMILSILIVNPII